MGSLSTLLILSTLMAVASFITGSLPLAFTLSSSQLRLISALGMGVLVGTSLIVIIPEGIETLYSSTGLVAPHSHGHSHAHRRDFISNTVRWEHPPPPPIITRRADDGHASPEPAPSAKVPKTPDDKTKPEPDNNKQEHHHHEHEPGHSHSHDKGNEHLPVKHKEATPPNAWIGIGLISGFVMMYLIDQLPQYASTSSKQQNRPYHMSLDNLGSGLGRESSQSPQGGGIFDFVNGAKSSQAFSTTMGLVIHSATDGIALGASSSNANLSFIIFIAIMVHKAPASFGLTSVLLKQGLSTRAARGHLLIFSLAAPAGAIATWVVANTILAGHASDKLATQWWTGMLLLFSGGTFLYVAMHNMLDTMMDGHRDTQNGHSGEGTQSQPSGKSVKDLIASTVGMILPLFLQIGHEHGHGH